MTFVRTLTNCHGSGRLLVISRTNAHTPPRGSANSTQQIALTRSVQIE